MPVYKGLFGESEGRTSTIEQGRPKRGGVVPGLFGGSSALLPEDVRTPSIDIPARSLLKDAGRAIFTPEIASRALGIEGGRTPGEELQEKYAIGRKGIKADYSERFVNEFATGFMGEILDIATTPFAYLIPPIIRKGGGPIVKKLASTKVGRTTLGRLMTNRFKNNPMSSQFWDDISELTSGRLPRAKPVKSIGGQYRKDPLAREEAIRRRGVKPEVKGFLEPPGGLPKKVVAPPKPKAPAGEGKVIEFDSPLPTDAMAVLNRQFYNTMGMQIPEKFWEGMTAGKLVNGFEELGLGEEIIKESNSALRKAGYRKLGNIMLTEEGAIPEKLPSKPPEVKKAEVTKKEPKEDDSFDFGANVQKYVTQDIKGVSELKVRLEKIDDAAVKGQTARDTLGEIREIKKVFVKKIKPDPKLKEELARIPKIFLNKSGVGLDEIADMANTSNIGVNFAKDTDVIDFLEKLVKREAELKAIIESTKDVYIRRKSASIIKQRIKDMLTGARQGRSGYNKELLQIRSQLIRYAKENLPLRERGKLLSVIAKAKNEKTLKEAFDRMDQIVTRIDRGDAIKELRETFKDIDLKKLRPEYRSKIEPIIDSIDPVKRTKKTMSGLVELVRFIEREPANQVPQTRLNDLKILSQKPIEELSVEEVRDITDTVRHLARLNDLKNNLIIKGKLRKAEDIRAESIRNIEKHTDQRNASISGLDSLQMEKEAGVFEKVQGVWAWNAELKTEILDAQDSGIIQEVLYRGIDDGVAVQFDFEHKAEDYFKEKFKGINLDKWSRTFQIKETSLDVVTVGLPSGRKLKMTKGERVAFYLHSLNENNTRHLLEGGYSFSGSPSKIVSLDDADLSAIVKSLTSDEVTVGKAINAYLNGPQKEAINKVSVDLLGHEIAREANYFPIRTSYLDRFRDDLIKSSNYSQKTLEGMGIFKERQSAKNALIIDDAFSDLYRSIKSVGSYVGLASPLRNAKMLLNDNDFQIAARKAGKNHYITSLKRYLERVEGDAIRFDELDKLVQDRINKLDVAILGLNPWVMMKQPISYIAAGTEMGPKYLKKGGIKPGSKAELEEIKKWSPHLRDRFEGNVTREMGELAEVGRVKKFFTGKEVISNKFMEGIRAFDKTAIASIWRAVKLEVAESNPALKGNAFFEKVADRSWEVIRRTQPTFHIKDRSDIGMNRSVFIRLLTKYSSQRNKNYMMVRRGFEKYNRSEKKAKDKADLAGRVAIITLISPLLLIATDALRDVTYGRNQKKQLFTNSINFLKFNFGNIYFLGDAFSSIASKVEKGTFAGYDIENPVSSTIDEAMDMIAEGVRGLQFAITKEKYKSGKNKGELKWKNSLRKMATGALELAGKVKGIPVHTVRRLLEAGARVTKKAFYGNT